MNSGKPDRLMVTLEVVQLDIAVLKEATAFQNASEREKVEHWYLFKNHATAYQRADQELCEHLKRNWQSYDISSLLASEWAVKFVLNLR